VRILLDTGILLRLTIVDDPIHATCVDWAESIRGARLAICPQVLYEYWVVATRPREVGGYGLPPPEAFSNVQSLSKRFDVFQEPNNLYLGWLDLCLQHSVCGRPAHDARLVALMLASGIDDLATLYPQDFKRYPINVHVPKADGL
jgi:predicted nucleic acid-binding protein